MQIFIAKNRSNKRLEKKEITFEELRDKLKTPYVSGETLQEYLNMPRDTQDNLKDIGGFVGGKLRDGRRTKKAVINRSIIALDADNLNSLENLELVVNKLRATNYNYIIHSTRKNSKKNPRIRILIPLKSPINPEKYEPIVRGLCSELGLSFFDPTTVDFNRLMFWPSVCIDTQEDYVFNTRIGAEFLDADEYLNSHFEDWTDVTEWPTFENELSSLHQNAEKQEDPLTKEGPIGIFCRAYSVPEAIDKFLSSVYREEENNRYSYIPGSTSNGAICYDDKFLYSFHATDPTSETLCNSYDLVRIHKFGDTQKSKDSMFELIANDLKCQEIRAKEAAEEMASVGVEEDENDYIDLFASLETDGKGQIKNTVENVCTILRNDPLLKEAFYEDVFAEKLIVTENLPWRTTGALPREWTDEDDSGLRGYLERYYYIYNKQKTDDAFNVIIKERSVHPVKDYLNSLNWDGVPRLDTLLIDYFGAEDNVYTREAIRKAMLAIVTRVFKPGAKFDNMPILVGEQGVGKSTFLSILAGEWFTDSLSEFDGAGAYEMLQNKLIVEVPELNGFNNKEVNQIKQFLSKQADEYRAPYARRKVSHPRQCVIFGTTNDAEFLRDRTGNRRFWPIQLGVNEPTKDVWKDLEKERDQIWAEARIAYIMGETLLLSKEALALAQKEQKNRLEDDPREGMIIEFISREIPVDWDTYDYNSRMSYWSNPERYKEEFNVETVRRDRICAMEILRELFHEPRHNTKRLSREINSILSSLPGISTETYRTRYGKEYGIQRGHKISRNFYE